MVAALQYSTSILRRDDVEEIVPPGFQRDEKSIFFEKLEKTLLDTTHEDDLYTQLMKREQRVLDTLNTVSNMHAQERAKEKRFVSITIANVWTGMMDALLTWLRLVSEADLKTLVGLLYSDTYFRINTGVWFAVVATMALVVWW